MCVTQRSECLLRLASLKTPLDDSCYLPGRPTGKACESLFEPFIAFSMMAILKLVTDQVIILN